MHNESYFYENKSRLAIWLLCGEIARHNLRLGMQIRYNPTTKIQLPRNSVTTKIENRFQ